MTPEDMYWENEMKAITNQTIEHFEQKFKRADEKIHPMLAMVTGDAKMVMAHRIQSAWKRVQEFITWEQFVSISSIFLETELLNEDMEAENLTDNILAFIHFELEDIGVEVTKIRNGMRVATTKSVKDIRDKVMDMIINHKLLDIPTKENIKLTIFTSLVG
jgi:nicotinic acid mononucleotide adenylyltransferase